MRPSELNRLQIRIELLTDLRVDICQTKDPGRLETRNTNMIATMKQIMPHSHPLEELRLSVQTIFMQLTSKIIKQVSGWGWLVLVESREGIFPALSTIN